MRLHAWLVRVVCLPLELALGEAAALAVAWQLGAHKPMQHAVANTHPNPHLKWRGSEHIPTVACTLLQSWSVFV